MRLIDHFPAALRGTGPYHLAWWQWLALPLLLLVAWVIGMVLGRVARSLLAYAARRTRFSWDDEIVAGIGGPLVLAGTAGAARLLIPLLELPEGWVAALYTGVRTAVVAAFFWCLLRVVTVAGGLVATSSWAQARPASRSLLPIAARIVQVAVLAVALVSVLSDLGFRVTTLLAGLGIGGLALALAAQKTVENLFGAFSMGLDQPFRVGDSISAEGLVTGVVEAVGLRSTRIRTLERTLITIPNGKLADMRIESFAPRDRIRFACVLGLARASTADQVRRMLAGIEQALQAQPKLAPGSVSVYFREITQTALDIEVQGWFLTTDFGEFQAIRQDLLLAFLDLVEGIGTNFAVPTRAVHVKEGAYTTSAPGRRD
jgi:MscS family membrane protein